MAQADIECLPNCVQVFFIPKIVRKYTFYYVHRLVYIFSNHHFEANIFLKANIPLVSFDSLRQRTKRSDYLRGVKI